MRIVGRRLGSALAKAPLLAKVVSLYGVAGILGGLGLLAANSLAPSQPVYAVEPQSYIQPKVAISARRVISGWPSRLTIKNLKIDLAVKDGTYDEKSKQWPLSKDAVHYATLTDLPNDSRGNTVLYGHNQNQVVGRMSDIRPGDMAIVKTTNGHEFHYSYVKDELVKPDDTDILFSSSSRPRLTIMTCDGFWSQSRRLMYFDLVEVR